MLVHKASCMFGYSELPSVEIKPCVSETLEVIQPVRFDRHSNMALIKLSMPFKEKPKASLIFCVLYIKTVVM